MSNSLESHVWWPARLLHPWDFPGKNTGVVCHFLCQGIFPAQGSNPGLPNCRQTLHHLSYQESPINLPTKQKETHRHREQTCGCQRGWGRVESTGSLGLADANYYIKNGSTTKPYCIAQGTIFNIHNGK